MIHLSLTIAVILSAYIEWIRIKAVLGRWLNVPKWVSVTIGAALFFIVLWIFNEWSAGNWWLAFEYACIRGFLYDPFLNRFRGLKLDYQSDKTNSWMDNLQARLGISFTLERILFALAAIGFLILFEIS